MRANVELSRVRSLFDLTENQNDQIFQKFAKLEETSPAGRDRESRQKQAQKRAELLQGILKPEQIIEYQEMQSTRRGRG